MSVGVLRLPRSRLMPLGPAWMSVTAMSSRADGLLYAVGTSTGHTLLYDIRAAQPFALKNQGQPATNFAAIKPAADLSHIHHAPASGLLMTANKGIQMATYYILQLGPAPRWASFLENITEEMEDQTMRSVYEDYKFVERSELKTLGLDHLMGTPTLKPYMYGYFLSLKLYDAARVITNPFAYAEHREKIVRERMEKMAETRIRAKKDGTAAAVKVNKVLAEKILHDEECEQKYLKQKRKRVAAAKANGGEGEAGDAEGEGEDAEMPDAAPRPDPTFAVDETSRKYVLMTPYAAAHRRNGGDLQRKTAVEEEEEEEDKFSSNGLEEGSGSDSRSRIARGELSGEKPARIVFLGDRGTTKATAINAVADDRSNFVTNPSKEYTTWELHYANAASYRRVVKSTRNEVSCRIRHGTQDTPLISKNFFHDLGALLPAVRNDPSKLGLGQTSCGGDSGMAALEGFVAALEVLLLTV
ncbi:hypothetical protein K438DRAFT_2017997 [Mycena galopus ATCC 62051]|nr:hypothetical protein K438DRAFT_2017997 [Mycena galopus ATCC 62051]